MALPPVITAADPECFQKQTISVAEEDRSLPIFTPGAHIDLFLGNGLIRQYSLCGDPMPGAPYRLAVALDARSRGGSIFVHDKLVEGARLAISSPRNLFVLDETLDTYVLIAGGIGVTPILAMARHLHALGKRFTLQYCARSRNAAAFYQEIAASDFHEHVHYHFDDESESAADLDMILQTPIGSHGLYVCGPSGLMDLAFDRALACGWAFENLHREDFAAIPTQADDDKPFVLVVKETGEHVPVPAGVTAAQALERAGYFVSLSCEQGICGSCVTSVHAGLPDNRDTFLTKEERASNSQFTPCCSRALTDSLIVDI